MIDYENTIERRSISRIRDVIGIVYKIKAKSSASTASDN